MKKNVKLILTLILIIINILFIPLSVNALEIPVRVITDTTPIVIDNTININPYFVDNTNTSTKAFGIGGTVINTLPKDVDLVSTTTYYDQNNNVITTSTISQLLPAETTIGYNNMTDLYKTPVNISVQDIKYYSMNIEVQETKEENYTPSLMQEYQYYEYLIDGYDINIKVNENNTFDINEKLTVNFLAENKHGIFRKLPTKNTVERLNGTTSTNRAQITNINVDKEYTTSRENNNLVLKIGSPSFTVSGMQQYNISYKYNIGKDKAQDYDEFYFNLIGPGWNDTAIGNVTFTIEMPKEFDSSKLGFSSGYKGSTENSNVVYTVSDNTIKGKYNGILNPNEALTVRLELDEGYFVGAGYQYDTKDFISILLPLIFVIIGLITWLIYGKDRQVVDSVEFYPPEGFNSLDVAFAYNGTVDSIDVTSLLIYLANKGYIKIGEEESNSYFSNHKGFRITKVKDYDGKNINEQLFLDGLFRYKKVTNSLASQAAEIDNITSVTDVDLYNKFYLTTNKIKNNMNTKENKYKIFEKNSLSKRTIIIIFIILTFCIITIPPCLKYSESELILFALLFPGIGFSMLIASLVGLTGGTVYVNGKPSSSKAAPAIFGVVWGSLFGGIPFAVIMLPTLLNDFVYLFGYIIGIICVFFLFMIMKYIPKRTEEGTMLYGKIKGFKKFLESSEKAQLESMVMQNPKYFYDVLPYTYVLGISDKWIKKFETINLQAPNWYDSRVPFNAMAFGSFISNTMNSAHSSMASSPSSSSGGSSGSSSGGGSSGGGSGGGGGGSW